METNKKGFTLLEMSLSFVLFAILIESIWGFFATISKHSIQLEQQIRMSSEAASVADFIRQELHSADEVCIVTTLGTILEANSSESKTSAEVINESLKAIKYRVKVPKTSGEGYTQKTCEIVLSSVSVNSTKGKQKLSYTVNAVDGSWVGINSAVISEMIEDIKVTRYKNSDLIEFTCEIYKNNETNPKLKIIKKFMESLEYKGCY